MTHALYSCAEIISEYEELLQSRRSPVLPPLLLSASRTEAQQHKITVVNSQQTLNTRTVQS